MKKKYLYIIAFLFLFISCSGSDDGNVVVPENNQEETIEEEIEEEEEEETEEEEVNEGEIDINGTTWSLFNKDVFSVAVTDDGVTLDLEQNAIWYQGNQGGLLYQNITGDFTISATVMARRKSNDVLPPNCNVCLGGLMARNPDSGSGENYVHLVSGNTPENDNDGIDELGFEHKNTTNSVSPFEPITDGSSDHELQMVREGNDFSLYSRDIGATDWNLVITHNRPDLPATLQVGLNIYTASGGSTADLRVIFEDIVVE